MIDRPRLDVLVATGNAGKIREIQESLRGVPVRLRYLWEFEDISPVEEVGATYEENAILKAVSYSKQTGVCALADDSGLEVDALGGLPGVLSARYGGEYASDQGTDRQAFDGSYSTPSPRANRTLSSVVWPSRGWPRGTIHASSDDPRVLHVCEGKCEGRIGEEPRGNNGFGYDPVFVPATYDRTFAELPSEVKGGAMSHRAQALAAMRGFLNRWIA